MFPLVFSVNLMVFKEDLGSWSFLLVILAPDFGRHLFDISQILANMDLREPMLSRSKNQRKTRTCPSMSYQNLFLLLTKSVSPPKKKKKQKTHHNLSYQHHFWRNSFLVEQVFFKSRPPVGVFNPRNLVMTLDTLVDMGCRVSKLDYRNWGIPSTLEK